MPLLVGVDVGSTTVKAVAVDAAICTVIEQIIGRSGTPYFAFKDIDENRLSASIKIRVETIDHFLSRYGQDLRNDRIDSVA